MLLVNTEYIAGKELEMLGLVKGSTIQSKHMGHDISQSFKTLVGGELKAYTEMMNDARALATKRMCQEHKETGAAAPVAQAVRCHCCVGGGRFPLGERPDRVSPHRVRAPAEEERQIRLRRDRFAH